MLYDTHQESDCSPNSTPGTNRIHLLAHIICSMIHIRNQTALRTRCLQHNTIHLLAHIICSMKHITALQTRRLEHNTIHLLAHIICSMIHIRNQTALRTPCLEQTQYTC